MSRKPTEAAFQGFFSAPSVMKQPGTIALVAVMLLLFGACSPATKYFRHGGNMATAVSSFASPEVGTAVVVFVPSGGGADIDALRSEVGKALAMQLQNKGYAPTHLHSLTLPGSLPRLSFDGTRPHRSRLQGPVFEAAQRQGLSGVFVVWMEITQRDPIFIIDQGLTRQVGEGPKGWLYVVTRTEIYSSAGEPLCIQDAPGVEGMDSFQADLKRNTGAYRVYSEAEIAQKAVNNALLFLPTRDGE